MGYVVGFNRQRPNYHHKGFKTHKSPRRSWLSVCVGGGLIACFVGLEVGPPLVGCAIKGNITVIAGQRIYHVPGQEYYSATHINWLRGERWFCSEAAARKAGWRKARV
jgi:hypothetical protein